MTSFIISKSCQDKEQLKLFFLVKTNINYHIDQIGKKKKLRKWTDIPVPRLRHKMVLKRRMVLTSKKQLQGCRKFRAEFEIRKPLK